MVKTSATDTVVTPGARFSLFVDVTPKSRMHVLLTRPDDLHSVAFVLDAE